MNEFIVWDKEKKELYTPSQMNFNDKGEHIKTDRFEWCQYIGLKDINGKKIYADCSIVEFYSGNSLDDEQLLTGYFSFNNENLRYEIKDINTKESFYFWNGYDESVLTVIDTIQENKLGLIN